MSRSRVAQQSYGPLLPAVLAAFFVLFLVQPSPANESVATSFRLPLEGDWNPGRSFGDFVVEGSYCGFHLADDVRRAPDTPVFPAAAGTVKIAQEVVGYTIVIEHLLADQSRVCSVYYHLKLPGEDGIPWSVGDTVTTNTPLGFVSGLAKDHRSVPHLHFGIRRGAFEPGLDPRTEKWFFVGYTTIYRDGDRQCNTDDPAHAMILGEWEAPLPFIEAHAAPATGTIQGLVFVNPDDGSFPPEAVAGATVFIFSADSFDLLAVTETDSDGRYAISLAPGTYALGAFKAVDESTFFEGFADEPVILESGQVVEQNIEVVFIAPV